MRSILLVFSILLSPFSFGLNLDLGSSDPDCLLAFQMSPAFTPDDAVNPGRLREDLRYRYLVGDLNTAARAADGSLHCRGVTEQNPDLALLTELTDPAVRANFEAQVGRYIEGPYQKSPITKHNGKRYCIGQTLNACVLVKSSWGKWSARLVARFLTSSKNPPNGVNGLPRDTANPNRAAYSPLNYIASKSWDRRPYTPEDAARDTLLGGGRSSIAEWTSPKSGNKLEMPNYLYFRGQGFEYEEGNGLHEKMGAEGSELLNFIGAPVSLGCVRLNRFASKFLRWFAPRGARFFTRLDAELYWRSPPPPPK